MADWALIEKLLKERTKTPKYNLEGLEASKRIEKEMLK